VTLREMLCNYVERMGIGRIMSVGIGLSNICVVLPEGFNSLSLLSSLSLRSTILY
jgi:hypothetical protein